MTRRGVNFVAGSPLAQIVCDLSGVTDPAERRAARAAFKEDALLFRSRGRRYQTGAKLADAIAKIGGGSLLTATLLLIVGGQTGSAIVVTAALTLLLFIAGTIFWAYCDLKASHWDYQAEWLEAVLKETER